MKILYSKSHRASFSMNFSSFTASLMLSCIKHDVSMDEGEYLLVKYLVWHVDNDISRCSTRSGILVEIFYFLIAALRLITHKSHVCRLKIKIIRYVLPSSQNRHNVGDTTAMPSHLVTFFLLYSSSEWRSGRINTKIVFIINSGSWRRTHPRERRVATGMMSASDDSLWFRILMLP